MIPLYVSEPLIKEYEWKYWLREACKKLNSKINNIYQIRVIVT